MTDSVTIEFVPLLTLAVAHAYYSERCPDFEIWIPSGTGRLLAGGRVLAKTREDRLNLLFEKKEGGTQFEPLATLAGRTLRFGLKLLNPRFSNFTEMPFLPGEGLHVYRNDGADPRQLRAPALLPPLDPARNEEDAELARAGLFCLVDIEIDAAFYSSAPEFLVEFDAREETLKYYVVVTSYSDLEFNQLEVTDAGSDGGPKIDFDRVSASSFGADDIPSGLLVREGARVTLFRSQQPVARRETARKRIQLARDTDIIIPQLPQPGAAAASANLIVHLSK